MKENHLLPGLRWSACSVSTITRSLSLPQRVVTVLFEDCREKDASLKAREQKANRGWSPKRAGEIWMPAGFFHRPRAINFRQ
jgi:hypothetical protein